MKQVTIYTTPTCGFCQMEKRFLAEKQVAYAEKDVARDRATAEEMIEKSGQMGVPVTVVAAEDGRETIIVGFDRARLAEELGLAV